MRHELIEALSGALFTLALLALERLLPFAEPYNVLAACAVGAAGFAVFFTLAWRFRHSKLLRRFDDLHPFVGDWLETWHDGACCRYSIATIRYDEKARQYLLTGNSYDETGEWKALWTSHSLHYDSANCRLIYIHDGSEVGGRIVFGATSFHINDPKTESGRGFFVDDRSGVLSRFDCEFRRLAGSDKPWRTDPKAWVLQQHALNSRSYPKVRQA